MSDRSNNLPEVRSRIARTLEYFGQLIAILTFLGATGLIEVTPVIQSHLLNPSAIKLDTDQFFRLLVKRNIKTPDKLSSLLAEHRTVLLNHETPWPVLGRFHFEPFGVFAMNGNEINAGINPPGMMARNDTAEFKKLLGIIDSETLIPERPPDQFIRYQAVELIWRELDPTTPPIDLSTKRLSAILDEESGANATEIYGAVWVASKIISFVLLENSSNLVASDIEVILKDSESYGLKPLFVISRRENGAFIFSEKDNRLKIAHIFPRNRLVLVTESKSAISNDHIAVTWTYFSAFDKTRICTLLLLALLLSIILAQSDSFPTEERRTGMKSRYAGWVWLLMGLILLVVAGRPELLEWVSNRNVIWAAIWSTIGIGAGLINQGDKRREWPHYVSYYLFILVLASFTSVVIGIKFGVVPSKEGLGFLSASAATGLVIGFIGEKIHDVIMK